MNTIDPVARFDCRTRVVRSGRFATLAIVLLVPSLAGADGGSAPKQQDESAQGAKWNVLFDGRTLGKWKLAKEFDFQRHGKVHVSDGKIVLETGRPATGIKWTGEFPKIDYEVSLEGMRVEGDDFFCGMTFPVNESALTLVLGGWGGSVVGLSSIDGEPAVENETCGYKEFQQKRWYRIRLRVTGLKIEAWIDEEKIVDLPTENRKFTIYWEMEPMLPFGIATWQTTGALRNIRMRRIKAPGQPEQRRPNKNGS